MNPIEVAVLLTYLESVDRRQSESDEEKANLRIQGWATILDGVDADWAMQQARRYYSTAQLRALEPGALADRWRTEQRVEEARVPQSTAVDRERLCQNSDICVCEHTVCMDGFLDAERKVRVLHGLTYLGVPRCPACRDAVEMRRELTPYRGRRSRR